ncbi:MAG: hypothetical protein WDN69_13335 [Aliidongia sp.]
MAETQARPDARLAGNLAEIRRAAERARDLIGRILAFGNAAEARRHPMSIQSLIAETASLLSATLPPTIELAIHMKTERRSFPVSPRHLQQVLLNLCNNAAQAMDGSGCIEIDTVMREFDRAQPLSHGELAPGCYGLHCRERRRTRHERRGPAEDLRTLLHHASGRQRPRSRNGARNHTRARRRDACSEHAGCR